MAVRRRLRRRDGGGGAATRAAFSLSQPGTRHCIRLFHVQQHLPAYSRRQNAGRCCTLALLRGGASGSPSSRRSRFQMASYQ